MKLNAIPKGRHNAVPWIQKPVLHAGGDSFAWQFVLHENCLYNPIDWENDYNKLCGISFLYHHHNSIRLAWRQLLHDSSRIQFAAYSYYRGKRSIVPIADSEPMTIHTIRFTKLFDAFWQVYFDDVFCLDVLCQPACFGYFLGGYFGGNAPAPHDMTYEISYLPTVKKSKSMTEQEYTYYKQQFCKLNAVDAAWANGILLCVLHGDNQRRYWLKQRCGIEPIEEINMRFVSTF